MKKLSNVQYKEFILSEIIRPFQNSIRGGDRIENLVFRETTSVKSFNYFDLFRLWHEMPEWSYAVCNRLKNIYSEVDFSFFPKDRFANILQLDMMSYCKIKSISPFENESGYKKK